MNIIFVENLFNPERGGVQRVTYVLACGLLELGHNVCIAHFENDDVNEYNKPGLDVLKFNYQQKSFFVDYLKCKKIDIIINQLARDVKLCNYLEEVRKGTNIKLVSCLHVSPNCSWLAAKWLDFKHPKYFLRALGKLLVLSFYRVDKKEMLNAYNKSDIFVVLSDSYIGELKRMLRIDGRKLIAIENPNTYSKTEIQIRDKAKEVLVVSRINESPKRISKVLDIWEIVSKEIQDWQLKIVGEGDNIEPYINRILRNKIDRISFEGRQNPKPYYERASIFMMTSAFEGFGMTITESMQFGVVPVAFDSCSVFRTIINHEHNGIMVPECDVKKYADEVIYLIKEEKERNRMSVNARNDVIRFDKKMIIQKWISVLENLCNRK